MTTLTAEIDIDSEGEEFVQVPAKSLECLDDAHYRLLIRMMRLDFLGVTTIARMVDRLVVIMGRSRGHIYRMIREIARDCPRCLVIAKDERGDNIAVFVFRLKGQACRARRAVMARPARQLPLPMARPARRHGAQAALRHGAPGAPSSAAAPIEDRAGNLDFREKENVNVTCASAQEIPPTGARTDPPSLSPPPAAASLECNAVAFSETPPEADEVTKLLAAIRNPRTMTLLRGGHALRLDRHGLLPPDLRHHLPPREEAAPPPRPIADAYPVAKPNLRSRLGNTNARTPPAECVAIADELADELGGEAAYYLAMLNEVVAGRRNRLVVAYEKAKGRGVHSRSGTFGYYARGGPGGEKNRPPGAPAKSPGGRPQAFPA